MRIVSPPPNQVFTIASDTTAPVIDVHTDLESGGVQWRLTTRWRAYTRRGTGNIGWTPTLQDRDRDDYRLPHDDGANWNYYGVCYVDSLLGG